MELLHSSEKELTFSKSELGAKNVPFARLLKIYANYRAEKSPYNIRTLSCALYAKKEAKISGDSFGTCMDMSDQILNLPVPQCSTLQVRDQDKDGHFLCFFQKAQCQVLPNSRAKSRTQCDLCSERDPLTSLLTRQYGGRKKLTFTCKGLKFRSKDPVVRY